MRAAPHPESASSPQWGSGESCCTVLLVDFAERAARNEEVFREVNARIEAGTELHGVETPAGFHCGCDRGAWRRSSCAPPNTELFSGAITSSSPPIMRVRWSCGWRRSGMATGWL